MSDQRVAIPPINHIFKCLQQLAVVTVALYEQPDVSIRGTIRGFDEFMNVVLEDAVEIRHDHNDAETVLGRMLLKGDNISIVSSPDV